MSDRWERGPLKLPRIRLWTVYVSAFGVWLTGVLWLVYHYFLQTPGQFGMRAHPLETWWLQLHGLFSFAAIFALGLLWIVHIVRGWVINWRRWSGGILVGVSIVLTVTGFGLYYIDSTEIRDWTSIAHWIIGLAAIVSFLWHWLSKSLPPRN